MNEETIIEQEDYELNGYDESAIETDYYDIDGEESEDDIFEDDVFEDDDFDFTEEESEMDEARRPSRYRARARRNARIKALRRRRALMRRRPRGYRRPRSYVRPKTKKYFRPNVPSRPANTKNVVKAFGAASQDIAKTKAAVRKVDVDNKIQEQKLKKTFSSQSKRISANEYTAAATAVFKQLGDAFPESIENPYVSAILTAAPTFLQKPMKKEFYKDPRVLTAGLTALIVIAKEFRDKAKTPEAVQNVSISPPVKTIIAGDQNSFSFTAVARDSKGDKIDGKTFNWFAEDDSIVSIDANGKITGKKAGSTTVFAQEKDSEMSTTVTVKVGAAPK